VLVTPGAVESTVGAPADSPPGTSFPGGLSVDQGQARLSLPVFIRSADLIAMLADFAELEAALLSEIVCVTLPTNREYLEETARSLAAARGYLPPVLVIAP
jgi:hypothetical protein